MNDCLPHNLNRPDLSMWHSVDRERIVTNRPLAGTRPRGRTPVADKALEQELLADEKERAEHVMLVDLGRNDVGKVRRGRAEGRVGGMHCLDCFPKVWLVHTGRMRVGQFEDAGKMLPGASVQDL